jgi:protoporphyrin/coproporphyrin ferrochelatase
MKVPDSHPPILPPKIGVLLVNLGSPDAPEPGAVRRYLKQFLSDKRVVEIPALVWQPILCGIILNTRPRKSAHAYQQVWRPDGAPLIAITKAQAAAMTDALGPAVGVDWAMRYGSPSIPERLAQLKEQGCTRILIAPLYPQYSGATTGSVMDNVFASLMKMRWQPALRSLPPYFDEAVHIEALATSINRQIAALDFEPEALVASFHSMPARTLQLGDPYHCQCQKTARLLSEAVGRELTVTFQSRLGRAKWLEPATDATLQSLGQKGVRKIAVVTPGFSADNLETLEEIAIRGREDFLNAGGTHFAFLECLNDSPEGVAMLRTLLSRQLEGWIEAP